MSVIARWTFLHLLHQSSLARSLGRDKHECESKQSLFTFNLMMNMIIHECNCLFTINMNQWLCISYVMIVFIDFQWKLAATYSQKCLPCECKYKGTTYIRSVTKMRDNALFSLIFVNRFLFPIRKHSYNSMPLSVQVYLEN